jgi:hypothetical protein
MKSTKRHNITQIIQTRFYHLQLSSAWSSFHSFLPLPWWITVLSLTTLYYVSLTETVKVYHVTDSWWCKRINQKLALGSELITLKLARLSSWGGIWTLQISIQLGIYKPCKHIRNHYNTLAIRTTYTISNRNSQVTLYSLKTSDITIASNRKQE